MNSNRNPIFAPYIVLILLIIIRLVPYIFPISRTWGFNHLVFLSTGYSIAFFAIAWAALMLPLLRNSEKIGDYLANKFTQVFYEGNSKYIVRISLIAVLTALFIIFSTPTHFLGDGYPLLNNIASETGSFIKWSEQGVTMILLGVQSLIGPKSQENALMTFQIISIVSGITSLWFFFLIAGSASENSLKRMLVFAALSCSGVILLFFGYVESYPMLWIGFSGFIFFGLRYSKTGHGLPAALIFLLFSIFIHLQGMVLVPAFIYLAFCRDRGLDIYRRHRKWFIGAAVVILVAGIMMFAYKYRSDLYFENMFLPLFSGKPIYPVYALISIPHLLDIFSQLILLSPLWLVFLALSAGQMTKSLRKRETAFLALAGIGSLSFLFIIDPKLTMARDWDLFSISAGALTILLILLIRDSLMPVVRKLLPAVLILLIIMPLPFLLTTLNEKRSIEYMEYMIDLDLEKSFSSIFVLNKYLEKHGYTEKADSLQATYNKYPFSKSRYDWAIAEIESGNLDKAWRIFQATLKDPFDQNYHVILKELYLREKNYVKALEHVNKAIQLQSYADYLYGYRGEILLLMNRLDEAMKDFRKGYKLNSGNITHSEGMAAIFFRQNQNDSGIYYTSKMIQIDSTRSIAYYMLSKAYIRLKNIKKAQEYADRYARFVHDDSTLMPFLKQLLSDIKKLEGGQSSDNINP